MAKSKTVKFEVGQLVNFSGNRVGQVSRIAKNGAIYVIVLGEKPRGQSKPVKNCELRKQTCN